MLAEIEFDLEFDLPCRYLLTFRHQYSLHLREKLNLADKRRLDETMGLLDSFLELSSKFARDSYLHPLCLYFPAPVITAACLLLADRLFPYLCPN